MNPLLNLLSGIGGSIQHTVSSLQQGFQNFVQSQQQKQQPQPARPNFDAQFKLFQSQPTAQSSAQLRPTINTSSLDAGFKYFLDGSSKVKDAIFKNLSLLGNEISNQPILRSPAGRALPYSPTVGQTLNFGKEAILQPAFRVGMRTILSAAGDKQFVPDEPFEQFMYGNEPVKNWKGQFADTSSALQGFGVNKGVSDFTAPGLAIAGGLLDITPFGGGGAKKGLGMKLAQEGELAIKQLPKIKRLEFVLNWGQKLIDLGFSKAQVDRLEPKIAMGIIKNKVKPSEIGNLSKVVEEVKTKVAPVTQMFRDMFADWVNARAAAPTEGLIQKRAFQDLDSLGVEGIFKFQAGENTGRFADVKKFFDDKYNFLQQHGIEFGYKSEYLPQLWADSADKVEQVFQKQLGTRPAFTLKSVFKDYAEGLQAGLTPRYQTIGDLAAWYEQKASKAVADKIFLDYLKKSNLVVPADGAPQGFRLLENFPKISSKEDPTKSFYAAEPGVANWINNYLNNPEGAVSNFADFASRAKQIGLSGGIPNTALNFHGLVNIFRRDLVANANPISIFFRDAKWLAHPNSAAAYVDNNLKDAAYFIKHGLTITTEDWDKFRNAVPTSKIGQVENWIETYMGDPLFKKTLPAIKVSYAKKVYQNLLPHMSETEAAKEASKATNSIFGGINLDALGRNKDTQNLLRSIFLAPDWAETQFRIGKGIVKGMLNPRDPRGQAYRTITRNILFFYVAENMVNKLASGHWMFENEGSINNKFSIDTGTYDSNGKHRYLNTWGTAQDFFRIPFQIIAGLVEGDPSAATAAVSNRFSLPVSAGVHLLTNQDYLHRPLYGQDVPTGQAVVGIGNEVLNGLGIPVQVRSGIDYISGKSSGEQALVNAIELPIRYNGTKKSEEAAPYFNAKDRLEKNLTPDQKKIVDYLTTSQKKGGPTTEGKAELLLKNQFALDYYKKLQLASDAQNPLYSRPDADIKAYLAYQLATDTKQKAQVRLASPWIPQVQLALSQKFGEDTNQQVNAPSPIQKLTPEQVMVVSAYTAAPQGSIQRKQLLAGNPWLKQYWDANSQYYAQNQFQDNSPLAQYLTSVGIDPSTQTQTTSGFSSFPKLTPLQRAKNALKPKATIKKFKIPKGKKIKAPKINIPKFNPRPLQVAKPKKIRLGGGK